VTLSPLLLAPPLRETLVDSAMMTPRQEKEQTPVERAGETLEKGAEKKDPPRPGKRDEYVTEWAQ
jgi:hypothetical protein